MVLSHQAWSQQVIGVITPTLDVDSDHGGANDAIELLKQEFSWGTHIGVQAMLLPCPRVQCLNYARVLKTLCSSVTFQQIWIHIPLVANFEYCNTDISDGWKLWQRLLVYTGHNPHIYIALDLTRIQSPEADTEYLNRWRGEHVKAVILHTRNFLKNSAGFPVLSKAYQSILAVFIELNVHIILKGCIIPLNWIPLIVFQEILVFRLILPISTT